MLEDNSKNLENGEEEFSEEEQHLIRQIQLATRRPLPPALAARIEADIARGPTLASKPSPPAWVRWGALAAVLVVALVAAIASVVVLTSPHPVTAADVQRRVDEAVKRNTQPGSILHRTYTTTDVISGIANNGNPFSLSYPVAYEDWGEVGDNNYLSLYKAQESYTIQEQAYKSVTLYDEKADRYSLWITPPGQITEFSASGFKFSANELENREQFLNNPRQTIYKGTAQFKQVSLLDTDRDNYILRYSFDAEQTLEGLNIKSSGVEDFYVSRKDYQVVRLVYTLTYKDVNGHDVTYTRDAKLASSELFAPDPARSAQIFTLDAPPGTPVEKQ